MISNSESDGRYHSNWLDMIYPRLKLAKNLLSQDGVVVISIDDSELSNLKRVCDEIFGESCWIATIVWHNSSRQNDLVAVEHEYILVYGREPAANNQKWNRKREVSDRLENLVKKLRAEGKSIEEAESILSFEIDCLLEEDGHKGTKDFSWLTNYKNIDEQWNIYYPVDLSGEGAGPARKFGEKIVAAPPGRHWMGQEYIDELLLDNRIVWRGERAYRKLYISESLDNLKSIIRIPTRNGSEQLKKILGKDVFDKPKPVNLLSKIFRYILAKDDIVLDFFAGSGTTAHSVMELNGDDGGYRRWILVQLPEEIVNSPSAEKFCKDNGLSSSIAEISKERVRRCDKAINKNSGDKSSGFRVLKVDSSNMADIYYSPDMLDKSSLGLFVDNIKPDRNSEDLLFQVMLDWGVDLALPISTQTIQRKEVFFVDGNALVACFDAHGGVDEDFVKELAKHLPLRVVFRDAGFKDSAVKINVEQIFKSLSPSTEVKCI